MKRFGPEVWVMFIVLAIAFVLRITGIGFGLPGLDHPDEPALVDTADVMARTNDFNPHFFHYPSFLIYVLMIVFKLEYSLESLGVLSVSESTLYLSARVLVAVLGTAMILVVYLIGRKLYGNKIGILSAIFITVMPMAVRDSHYATVDIPMTFFATVAFLSLTYLARHGNLRYGLVAGVFIGLAGSTKQSGALLIAPLFLAFFLHHIYHNPNSESVGKSSLAILRGFTCSCIVALLVFIATSPFAVLDHETFLADLRFEMEHMSTGHGVYFLNTAPGWIHHVTDSLRFGMSPWLETVSLLGVASMVMVAVYCLVVKNPRGNRKGLTPALLLLSWILPYYLIIGSWEVKFERYVIPLLPFLAITASYAVLGGWQISQRLLSRLSPSPRFGFSTAVCFIVAAALLVPPLQSSLKQNRDFTKDTTKQVALEWICHNVPEGSVIVREMYTPETETLAQYETKFYGFRLASVDMSEIEEADYVIVSSGVYDRFYANPAQSEKEVRFYDCLAEVFTLAKVFTSCETLVGPELKVYRVP